VLVGRVHVLTRYPVKSMLGEVLPEVAVDERGVVADRRWAVYTTDGGIGSGKTTRRFRRVDGLLQCRATLGAMPEPQIALPSGSSHRAGDPATGEALSELLERPVQLRPETDVRHHDESAVHLVTTASVQHLGDLTGSPVDASRFRANVVIDTDAEGFAEDDWTGRELAVGDTVVLALGPGMPRCVMVDAPGPGGAPQPRLLKVLSGVHDLRFGLQATVRHAGTIRTGDVARLL